MAFSEPDLAKIDIDVRRAITAVGAASGRDVAGGLLVRCSKVLGSFFVVVFLSFGLSSAKAIAAVKGNQEAATKGMLPEEQVRWLINKLRRKAGECGGGSSADSSESGKDPSAAPNNTDNHRVAIRFTQADGTVVTLDCDFGK